MTRSMFDQIYVKLKCPKCKTAPESILVGRLEGQKSWPCSACGALIDLTSERHASQLAQEIDTADQIDKQKRQRGHSIERETVPGK